MSPKTPLYHFADVGKMVFIRCFASPNRRI